jgi:hypothetical protein
MTNRIDSRPNHGPQLDTTHGTQPSSAPRTQHAATTARTTHHASEHFETSTPPDRRLTRALAASRPVPRAPTAAETQISQRIAIGQRTVNNLGALLQRMERTPAGPSFAKHRGDVPYAPPLEHVIREQQTEVLNALTEHLVGEERDHGIVDGLEIAASFAERHGHEETGSALGAAAIVAEIAGPSYMVAHTAIDSLEAGDARHAAAVARQRWEDQQGSVDGHIAQSRADGRDAVRAANVANTAEPVTIDWDRFASDGDYACGAMDEARTRLSTEQARVTSDRALLTHAQSMSPTEQTLFPWQLQTDTTR